MAAPPVAAARARCLPSTARRDRQAFAIRGAGLRRIALQRRLRRRQRARSRSVAAITRRRRICSTMLRRTRRRSRVRTSRRRPSIVGRAARRACARATASSASLPTKIVSDDQIRLHGRRDRAEEELLLDRPVALDAAVDHAVAKRGRPRVQPLLEQLAERLAERDLHREDQRIAQEQDAPLIRRPSGRSRRRRAAPAPLMAISACRTPSS